MPNMIIFVLDDVTRLEDVVAAWRAAGSSGVTILNSTGAGRLLGGGRRDDVPLFPGLRDILKADEVHHRTLFTVIDDSVDVEAFFDATEAVIGSTDEPHSGILVALPVIAARGIVQRKYESDEGVG